MTTLAELLRGAMRDADVRPMELVRALVEFRGQDPDDRRAWDAARQAIARWRNGRAHRIDDPEEAAFIANFLGKPPETFVIPEEVRPLGAAREADVRRLEERIAQLERLVEELRVDRAAHGQR